MCEVCIGLEYFTSALQSVNVLNILKVSKFHQGSNFAAVWKIQTY